MKRYLFALLMLFSTFVFAEGCDINKKTLTSEEIKVCTTEQFKTATFMKAAVGIIQTENIGIVSFFFKAIIGYDAEDNESVAKVNDAGTRLISAIFIIVELFAKWFFGFVIAYIGLVGLILAAHNGQFLAKGSSTFATVLLIMSVGVVTGAFTLIIQILLGCSLFLGLVIFYIIFPPILNQMSLDDNGVKTRLAEESDNFATKMVTKSIQMHMDDLAARKMILVESGSIGDGYGRRTIEDFKFISCLANSTVEAPNLKYYIPPIIKVSMACANESDWDVYSVGYFTDTKSEPISKKIMSEIDQNQNEYRDIAYSIINTNCSNVFNVDEDVATSYDTACMKMSKYGAVETDANGIVLTVNKSSGNNNEILKSRIQSSIDRLAAVVYIEMLKEANTVAKPDEIKNISMDNLTNIFMLGQVYRDLYEKSAMRVIDISSSGEVAFKKNKKQFGFSLGDNIELFGGKTRDTTFGIDDFYKNLLPVEKNSDEALAMLDLISGKAATNMGMKYSDCLLKRNCTSANYNQFGPMIKVAKTFTIYVARTYAVSLVIGAIYKNEADQAGGKDPYLNARVHSIDSVQMFLLGLIVAVVLGGLTVLRVQVLTYVEWFYKGLLNFLIAPFIIGGAILMHTSKGVLKDDGTTLNDILIKHGFWDMLLRFPLIVIASACGLIVLNYMMTFASLILAVLFSNNFGLFDGGGMAANIYGGLMFIFLYSISFIATFFVVIKTVNEAIESAIVVICYAGQREHALDDAYGKAKSLIQKLRS